MSYSKHAHIRYNILDYCFRKRAFTFNQLHDYLNERLSYYYEGEVVSIRTLREDLKIFRDKEIGFGAPLPEKARILKYDDLNFSIATKPLLAYEKYLIDGAQQLLERFENNPKYDKLAEALIKFQDEEQQGDDDSKILFYDHNDEYKGIRFLKPLHKAIRGKQVLNISYQGFYDEIPKVFEFHPYVLKQYNRRWFVFGYNEQMDNEKWSIPLDERLISFNIMDSIQYKPSQINWDNHFREMVGVVRPLDATLEKVVLKFYNGRGQYFKTKPFHPDFDEFFEKERKDQVWFETIINRELIQQILSYGKDVEVLTPKSLIELLEVHVSELNSYYN